MAKIQGFTVVVFDGMLQPAAQKIAVLESAPGVDGVAVVKGGWTNAPQEVRTVAEVTSAAGAAALWNQYRTLSGQIITIIDQFGFTWPNVTVMRVGPSRIEAAGYSSIWRLEAQWLLLPDTTRPPGA
jgi:hypothetical protein